MKLKDMMYSTAMLVNGIFSSCSQRKSKDGIAGETGSETVRIKIQMSSGMYATRTSFAGPDHVTYVQLLVFKKEDEYYNLIYNAPVNRSGNIQEDIELGSDGFTGYHLISEDFFEDGVSYCLVAIGLDASRGYEGTPEKSFLSDLIIPAALAGNSVDAYLVSIEELLCESFSIANNKIVFPGIKGYFPVRDENLGYDINPIARSGFFAGCTYVTGQKNMPEVTVTAERRVAGVKACLKGIPQQIGGTEVEYIAIGTGPKGDLPTRYNKAIPLLPIGAVDDEYMDYIPNGSENKYEEGLYPIIAPLPKNVETFQPGAFEGDSPKLNYPDENLIGVTDGVVTLMGYLPPAVFPYEETGNNSTMMLYLLDGKYKVLSSRKIVHLLETGMASSREGTGIVDQSVTCPYDSCCHYPIMANHLYKIGSCENPVDLEVSEAEIGVSICD